MKEITVTLDQDDIDEARENGFIEREGIAFCNRSPRYLDIDEDDYKRTVILSPSTLYTEGIAVWPTVSELTGEIHTEYKVIAEYERPSLERFLESEIQNAERIEFESDNHRDEYWLGQLTQLRNVKGWVEQEIEFETPDPEEFLEENSTADEL